MGDGTDKGFISLVTGHQISSSVYFESYTPGVTSHSISLMILYIPILLSTECRYVQTK